MGYFFDTEFLEGTQNKTFLGMNVGKTKPTIDLISIGIVSEEQCDTKYDCGGKDNPCRVCSNYNSRSYYAISKDFNLKEAWNRFDVKKDFGKPQGLGDTKVYWLRENVLKPIMVELQVKYNKDTGKSLDGWSFKNFKRLIKKYGKTNKQIAEEVKEFIYKGSECSNNVEMWGKNIEPQFYGYYCDYDWVAFCWLFGKMIDLPNGFPMFCIDLKQESDRIYNLKKEEYTKGGGRNFINKMSNHLDYPKQTNEHNALADARWNYELYKFLNNL